MILWQWKSPTTLAKWCIRQSLRVAILHLFRTLLYICLPYPGLSSKNRKSLPPVCPPPPKYICFRAHLFPRSDQGEWREDSGLAAPNGWCWHQNRALQGVGSWPKCWHCRKQREMKGRLAEINDHINRNKEAGVGWPDSLCCVLFWARFSSLYAVLIAVEKLSAPDPWPKEVVGPKM